MSRIDIHTSTKKVPVTRNLYGILLEDVNREVDAGYYLELSYNAWKLFGIQQGEQIVEMTEKTDRIYRPIWGITTLLGTADLAYRNAFWNGNKAEAVHNEQQCEVSSKLFGVSPQDYPIVFCDEDNTSGTFEIEIKVNHDSEIAFGIFSSDTTKELRPFLWTIKNGRSRLEEREYCKCICVDSEKNVNLKENEYNRFSYTTDGKKLRLYINREQIHEIEIPSYPVLNAVVSDTDEEVFIKLVNLTDREDEVTIKLDCNVSDVYKAYILTGDNKEKCSYDKPYIFNETEQVLKGAARKFIYKAPPLSVNVLRLVKSINEEGIRIGTGIGYHMEHGAH